MSSTAQDSAAPRGLPERLAAAQEHVGRLGHDGRNDQQRFSFTSIHAIADATRRALAAEGLALMPTGVDVIADDEVTTSRGGTGYRVVVHTTWRLACSGPDGPEHVDLSSVGEAIDYGDKGHNKATTFARKNLLIGLLNLSTGDADPDEHAPEAAPRQRRQAPQAARPGPQQARAQAVADAERGAKRMHSLLKRGGEDGMSDEEVVAACAPAVKGWPEGLAAADGWKAAQDALKAALERRSKAQVEGEGASAQESLGVDQPAGPSGDPDDPFS